MFDVQVVSLGRLLTCTSVHN